MSELTISNNISSNFAKIENGLYDLGLSTDAVALFGFLNACYGKVVVTAKEIERKLSIGRHRRLKAQRELTGVGLYDRKSKYDRLADKFGNQIQVTSEPLAARRSDLDGQVLESDAASTQCENRTPSENQSKGGVPKSNWGECQNRTGGSAEIEPLSNTKTNTKTRAVKTRPARLKFPAQVTKQVTPYMVGRLRDGLSIVLKLDGALSSVDGSTSEGKALLGQLDLSGMNCRSSVVN